MESRLQKVLRQFNGDRKAAIRYCLRVSIVFPQFDREYTEVARALIHLDGGR